MRIPAIHLLGDPEQSPRLSGAHGHTAAISDLRARAGESRCSWGHWVEECDHIVRGIGVWHGFFH